MVVIIPVMAVEHFWVPGAVLSVFHSLSHFRFITTSEIDDVIMGGDLCIPVLPESHPLASWVTSGVNETC